MKDKAGSSNGSAKPNGPGIHAQPNGVPSVQVNAASKRKISDTGSSQLASKPHKKRIAYMNVSDEEAEKTSSRKMNGVVTNGVSASLPGGNNLRRRKSKGRSEGDNAKQLSLQEQRQLLPIAQGV